MTTINVTYEVQVMEHGKKVNGEACSEILVADDVATRLMYVSGYDQTMLEEALHAIERLRCRKYIPGSIKDIRPVKTF
jgi:hypothetical protein